MKKSSVKQHILKCVISLFSLVNQICGCDWKGSLEKLPFFMFQYSKICCGCCCKSTHLSSNVSLVKVFWPRPSFMRFIFSHTPVLLCFRACGIGDNVRRDSLSRANSARVRQITPLSSMWCSKLVHFSL